MRVACLITDDFEDSEFTKPAEALRAAGHEVTTIGIKAGSTVTGKKGQAAVGIDSSIGEVRPEQFDALFLPGGYSPDQLRADQRFVDFSRKFVSDDKPVFAVCHGPQLLLTAGLVKGRTLTAWQTVQVDLAYAGANVVDEEVVVDGRLITSRKPDDLDAFSRAAVEMLAGAGVR